MKCSGGGLGHPVYIIDTLDCQSCVGDLVVPPYTHLETKVDIPLRSRDR
jgi:hypothetical protein